MSRLRASLLALAAILALGLASTVRAQTDTDAAYSGAVTGQVTSVDASSITVKGPNDDGGTYAVDASTQVLNQHEKITVTDLKKGWGVVLNWDYAAPDKKAKVAKLIEVTDAP